MSEGGGRQLASKWSKTAALRSHPALARHIPTTRLYTPSNLRAMLNTHGMVVIKPIVGTGGHGVIKVGKRPGGYYHVYRTKRTNHTTFRALTASLAKVRGKRRYLIQKGIHLATIGSRPIDYRVKYVKTEQGWVYRAMIGRLARRGLFVTNLCKGGTRLTAAQGIRRSLSSRAVGAKKATMRKLTRLSTQVLEQHFPGIGQLGFDYGIDKKGRIWIFEVNTRPQ